MFAHPLLLYSGIIGCSFIALLGFIPLLIYLIKPEYEDDLFIGVSFAVLGLLMIVSFLMCLPRIYVKITFGADTIVFKQAFKKETEYEYRVYNYVYKASYLHMLYKPQFIVFSQTRLNDAQLQNINQVPPSEKIIKIRYSKKTFQTLRESLPQKHRIKLEQCFPENK